MTRQPARIALALALLGGLAACSPLPPKNSSTRIYAPQPQIAVDASWPQVGWQLSVARPIANPLLDSNRIAVRPEPGQFQVYKNAAWADDAPSLVQNALLRGFEDSRRIIAVGRPGSPLRPDYVLDLDLRHFETVYADAGAPKVRIELQARLIAVRGNRVVAARRFVAEQAPSGVEVPAVAAAFETALGRLVGDVVGWTLVSGEASAQSVGR